MIQETLSAEEISVYTCQEPPLNYTEKGNQDGAKGEEVTGFATDVVREILARTNLDTTIFLIPWARAYNLAQAEPNVFLYSMARRPDREGLFKWVGPIARKKTMLFAKRGADLKITSLNDAKQVMSIGTMREDSKEQFLVKEGFTNLDSSSQWDQALKKLIAGRVSLWINTDLDAPVIAKKTGINNEEIESVLKLYDYDLYIGVSKNTPDRLVILWQHALDELKSDGTFQQLILKWASNYNVSNWVLEDGMLQVNYD
jgi:polar amino acid transport system substrate-binding protein